MDYRRLGRAGLKVSEICLGTMTFGNGADQAEATRMVSAMLDAGGTFFDTANSYVGGTSETMLGEALKGRRHDAIVATKLFNPMGHRPNDLGMSRLHIKQQIEASLKRLQTDYIDIYYIHHVDHQTPLDEMLRAFDDLVREGKVLYTGCSNYEAWRLIEAMWISQSNGWVGFSCYQPQYSLVVRDLDEEVGPACAAKGLGSSPGRRWPAATSPASTRRAASRCRARARPRAGASTAASSRPTMPRSCRRCSTSPRRSAARRPRSRCAG